jgi:histidine triad (HIT) family protein
VLVIPKNHFIQLDEMPPKELATLAEMLPSLSRAVVKAVGAEGYNILQNNGIVSGQAVMHVHFHIIPRREGDGLGYRWNAGKYQGDRAQQVHQQLINALKQVST